jgi:prepilin-type processing-associated H-X9-DG protein
MSTLFYPVVSASCPPMRPFWANIGSHKQADRGGTNALFGDTHVEWVAGNQIGSP